METAVAVELLQGTGEWERKSPYGAKGAVEDLSSAFGRPFRVRLNQTGGSMLSVIYARRRLRLRLRLWSELGNLVIVPVA